MPHHQLCIQYAVSDGADENSYDGLRAGRLGVYDLATRRSLRIPVPIQAIPPNFQVQPIAWSPDGLWIVVGSRGFTDLPTFRVYDAETMELAPGWVPAGLDALDWSQTHVLGCVAPRSIQAAGRVITLPAARRTDAAPYGFAVDAVGLLRPVAVTVVGNVATLGADAGAVSYQVLYYPLLTVRAPQGPRVQYDAAGAAASWEIVFEE